MIVRGESMTVRGESMVMIVASRTVPHRHGLVVDAVVIHLTRSHGGTPGGCEERPCSGVSRG